MEPETKPHRIPTGAKPPCAGIPQVTVTCQLETGPEDSVGDRVLLPHGPDARRPGNARDIARVPMPHRVRWIDPEGIDLAEGLFHLAGH